MADESSTTTASPASIGGYRVERELSAARTWLARAPEGRRVVLKALDGDCLLGPQLHPIVRDRLARVRELAHVGIANLYGVERCDDEVFLVWQFVDGTPLEEYLSQRQVNESSRATLAHTLMVSVQSLHVLGIVHGAIHGRNVIVKPDGGICLTHISPLLYNDPEADMESLRPLMEQLHYASEFPDMPESFEPGMPCVHRTSENASEARQIRRRTLIGAAIVALLGGIIAWGLWYLASQASVEAGEARSIVNPIKLSEPGVTA